MYSRDCTDLDSFCCMCQAFFDIIYKDDSAARLYHKEVNHDENITVTPWVDGRRTVEATMPVKLPETVKKFIGIGRQQSFLETPWEGQERIRNHPFSVDLIHSGT